MPTKPALGAIAGLGITRMSRDPIGSALSLAAEAVVLACKDAGLEKDDLDGLLINAGIGDSGESCPPSAVGALPVSTLSR